MSDRLVVVNCMLVMGGHESMAGARLCESEDWIDSERYNSNATYSHCPPHTLILYDSISARCPEHKTGSRSGQQLNGCFIVHPARNVVDPKFTGMEQSHPDCTREEWLLVMLGDFVATSKQQRQQRSLFRGSSERR